MLNVYHEIKKSIFYKYATISLPSFSGSASKIRPVLFLCSRFDLSDRDKFFDSKTRSSIVSIGFSRRKQCLIQHMLSLHVYDVAFMVVKSPLFSIDKNVFYIHLTTQT